MSNKKRLVSLLLIVVMVMTAVFATGCSAGSDVTVPQLRINEETNYWEVSYDNGETWESFDVKATATPLVRINEDTKVWEVSYDNGKEWSSLGVSAVGIDGANGANGKNGKDGVGIANVVINDNGELVVTLTNGKTINLGNVIGTNGKDGLNGTNGTDGKDGVDGADGKDGVDGTDGKDGIDGANGADGKTPYIGADGYWYIDGVSTGVHTGTVDSTFEKVAELTKDVNFGRASCFGTGACFNSVYVRILEDDHKYYDGAAGIANYLKGVFVEDNGVVTVNPNSQLRRISYTDELTLINFSSALSSYEEYIIRNNKQDDATYQEVLKQKELAIKLFNTVDYTAEGYHKHSVTGPYSFPSMGVSVVAMGSLTGQADTARFDTLIKNAYDNVDAAFYNSGMYLDPFYQLCAKYSWYDKMPSMESVTSLTDSAVLKYYAYGIDLEEDYTELWNAYVTDALADDKLDAAEAKAFAYHYAYQLTNGKVSLGIYGPSRAVVDYGVVDLV